MTTFFLYRLLITAISFQNIVKEASQKSGEIQFEFNQQKGNVYYCNEFGEFDFVSNGHFSSQAQDEYFMFNYSSEIALQTLIISKHHSIKIIQKDTFLVPQTGDLKKYAELNFNESYLKYNKSYKEPMFYKTAFFDEEYSNKPQKREENLDKELKKQRLFLNRYTKKNQLDSNFLELWDKYFFYNMLQKKFFLGFGQAKFNKFPNAYIKEICKEGINSQNDRFLFLHQYKVAMSLLVENLTLLSSDNNVNKNDRKYNIIVNNFRGRTKDYLLFNFIYDIGFVAWIFLNA